MSISPSVSGLDSTTSLSSSSVSQLKNDLISCCSTSRTTQAEIELAHRISTFMILDDMDQCLLLWFGKVTQRQHTHDEHIQRRNRKQRHKERRTTRWTTDGQQRRMMEKQKQGTAETEQKSKDRTPIGWEGRLPCHVQLVELS
jgi:hypothetical protein